MMPDRADDLAAQRAAQAAMARALRAALGGLPAIGAAQPMLTRRGRGATDGDERRALGGAWGSSAALACGVLAAGRGRSIAIAPTAEAADALLLDLAFLFPDLPVVLLPLEELLLSSGPELAANRSERLVALASLSEPGDGLLIVPGPVLLEELPSTEGAQLELATGATIDREALLARLAEAGLA